MQYAASLPELPLTLGLQSCPAHPAPAERPEATFAESRCAEKLKTGRNTGKLRIRLQDHQSSAQISQISP
jgi:hypothetical protein